MGRESTEEAALSSAWRGEEDFPEEAIWELFGKQQLCFRKMRT